MVLANQRTVESTAISWMRGKGKSAGKVASSARNPQIAVTVPSRPAGACKHKALHRELVRQPPSSCAQRQPHAQFAITCHRAHQQQVGDIGACDQQDEQHGGR